MTNQSAAKLIISLQKNQEGAFEALYKQFWPVVCTIARRKTRNAEDARDAAQEVFIKVLEKADTVRNPMAFNTWIYHQTQNACSKYRRQYHCLLDAEIPETNADYLPENHLETEALLSLADQLPEQNREAITLRYIEGFTPNQICRRTRRKVQDIHKLIETSVAMMKMLYVNEWEGVA